MPPQRNGPSRLAKLTEPTLIESAVALIGEGSSGQPVSLRAIASRAGVSPTAVYRHFADHDELITATVDWCWSEFDHAINVATDDIADPFERIRMQGRAYAEFGLGRTGVYRVLFSGSVHGGMSSTEHGRGIFTKLVNTVGAVLAARSDPRDPYRVATQVFTWIHGIVDLPVRIPG